MIWKIIGFAAATLTMFSFVPQILKTVKTKSVKDISLGTVTQLSLGVTLWTIYGIHIKDAIVIMANLVTLATMVVLLFLFYNYRKAAQ